MPSSPYHAGERAVQQRLGEQHLADRNAPAIRPAVPAGVAAQLARQPLVLVTSLDAAGAVWTSVLQGTPGFAHCPAPTEVVLEAALLAPAAADVLWANLAGQSAVSLLFIDLATKWRYRVNGRAHALAHGWRVDIEQAFLNCPQYVQVHPAAAPGVGAPAPVPREMGPALTPALAAWVGAADSFFVGSSDAAQALDTAYRGGPAGFVRVEAGGTLLVPDYVGNSMYNSLGNFAVNPAAGLLFLDAASGRSLQLTGRAEVLWQGAGPVVDTGGTGRFWRFTPTAWVVASLPAALPFR